MQCEHSLAEFFPSYTIPFVFHRDLALVVAALAYNQYFLRLQAANLKLVNMK